MKIDSIKDKVNLEIDKSKCYIVVGYPDECVGCTNPEEKPLSMFSCDSCDSQMSLCDQCVEENECPICQSIEVENNLLAGLTTFYTSDYTTLTTEAVKEWATGVVDSIFK